MKNNQDNSIKTNNDLKGSSSSKKPVSNRNQLLLQMKHRKFVPNQTINEDENEEKDLTNEQKNIDKVLKLEHRKEFKVLRFWDEVYLFASTTSLHGTAFILRAGNIISRVIWILILFGSLGAFIWHMDRLVKKYTKYELATSTSINYSNFLDFPSVTICNKNPLRKSKLENNADIPKVFFEFIKKGLSSNHYTSDEKNNTLKKRKKRDSLNSNSDDSIQFTVPPHQEGVTINATKPIVLSEEEFEAFFNNIKLLDFDKINTDTSGFDYFFRGNISNNMRKEILYSISLRLLSPDVRSSIGHQGKNFILDCSFNGKQCSSKNFVKHLSRTYGNCYTFNDFYHEKTSYRNMANGPLFGLDLILHLETMEYQEGLHNSEGAVVSIHKFGTRSEIEQTSLSIFPGTETSIGLGLAEYYSYKGHTHICIDRSNYKNLYYNYTQNTCQNICIDQLIATYCLCIRPEYFENYNSQQMKLRVCQSLNETAYDDELCENNIIRNFRNGKYDCYCYSECFSSAYDVILTANKYPPLNKWYDLINKVCATDPVLCEYYKREGNDSQSRRNLLMDNFINLKVFYTDSNYQITRELLSYEFPQLLSDFGGSMGLFLGASVITVIEVLDLVVGIFQWLHYLFKKRKEEIQKAIDEENKHEDFIATAL